MAKNGRDLTSPEQAPPPASYRPSTVPSLPASSGAWFGSPKTLLKKDTEFVETHTEYLQARQKQLAAAEALVSTRKVLELTCFDLTNIEIIKQHHFMRGIADRKRELAAWQHDETLAGIQHSTAIMEAETARLKAEIGRLEAQAALAERKKLQPAPTPEPPQPAPPSEPKLSLDEIEDVVTAGLPELSETSKFSFLRMLRGLLAEKDNDKQ